MTKPPRTKPLPPPFFAVREDPEGQDAAAIKALNAGNASASQQMRALKWIIECASGAYDQPFHPGDDDGRATAFACGRMFVGQQIVKQLKLPTPAKVR